MRASPIIKIEESTLKECHDCTPEFSLKDFETLYDLMEIEPFCTKVIGRFLIHVTIGTTIRRIYLSTLLW